MLMRFPDQRLSIGLTCNIANANTQGRAEKVADVVLAGAFTGPAAVSDTKAAPAYAGPKLDPNSIAGDYVSDLNQSAVVVIVDKGAPAAKLFGQVMPLVQVGPRTLKTVTYPIELSFGPDAKELTLTVFGEADPPYRRIAVTNPSPAETAALAGRYRSPELGTEWTIRVQGGVAYVKGRAQGEHPLEPVNRDIWLTDEGFFAPVWSADGHVTGFDFSASRMTRIRFDRVG
jgi:hypothetical protein